MSHHSVQISPGWEFDQHVEPDQAAGDVVCQVAAEDEVPTLFVTREVVETGNVFHVLTDLLNAYITLRMLGWEDIGRQARTPLSSI